MYVPCTLSARCVHTPIRFGALLVCIIDARDEYKGFLMYTKAPHSPHTHKKCQLKRVKTKGVKRMV